VNREMEQSREATGQLRVIDLTEIRHSLSIRTCWILPAIPTIIWRSGTVYTIVWARLWQDSKVQLPSKRCCAGCPI
jgi:hypothetical protein